MATSIGTGAVDPGRWAADPEASRAIRVWPPAVDPDAPEGTEPVEAELAAPRPLPPELPLPVLAPAPLADPVVLPVLPDAPVTLEKSDPAGAPLIPEGPAPPEAPAAPDQPPAPLEPVAARPEAWAGPEAAVPNAVVPDAAVPEAVAAPEAPDAPEVLPPVEPDDWLLVWVAGPEGPEEPPAPLPAVLFDCGLDDAGPLVPPVAVAPVLVPPEGPLEALPEELPVEPPLEPPVEVPDAGPLLPLPAVVVAAVPAAGADAGAGPLLRAATNARLEISPTTGAKVGDQGPRSNHDPEMSTDRLPPLPHLPSGTRPPE